MTKGWASMVGELVRLHEEDGAALVGDQDAPDDITNNRYLRVQGTHLDPSKVRKWLWQERKLASIATAIWSASEDGVSVVGFAGRKEDLPHGQET